MSPIPALRVSLRTLCFLSVCIAFTAFSLIWATRQSARRNPRATSSTRSSAAQPSDLGLAPAATTFTVNATGDLSDTNIGDGHCDVDGNLANGDDCTLRAAMQEGASNQAHTINFNLPSGSVITLNTQLPSFVGNITIVGPGSSQLTIERSTAGGTPNFFIFSFAPINGNFTNSISGLTISNGSNTVSGQGAFQGGCLVNSSFSITTLTDMTFRGCSGGNGGAISNAGQLTLTDSTLDGNSTSGAGGGIYNSFGGFTNDGTLNLIRTTVSNNSASAQGGAIANVSTGVVTITNSTISGNSTTGSVAVGDGGITNMSSGTVNLINATVTANTAPASGAGGVGNISGTINIGNSIVAKNSGGFADTRGAFSSQGYNLIGQAGGNGLNNGVNGDQVGNPGATIDPLLGPLSANGGSSKTHALLVGSPAIDAGNSSQTTDQRGRVRPFDDPNVANASGGNGSDIGAFEKNTLQVNTTADADDGACTALGTGNGCTLREAINAANVSSGEISFAPALTAGGPATINLLTTLPTINSAVIIEGPGASLLTVQRSTAGGTPSFRVLTVAANATGSVSGLTISNGKALNRGGAILNQGVMGLSNCVVSSSNGSGGGGIHNELGATLTIANCTIRDNFDSHFDGSGGGISSFGTLAIFDTTIQNNDAGANFGGGIYNSGRLTVSRSTINGNTNGGIFNESSQATTTVSNSTISTNQGAGCLNVGGTFTVVNTTITNNNGVSGGGAANDGGSGGVFNLRNTIVANNSGGSSPDISGAFQSQGKNLIGKSDGGSGFSDGVNGDQVGTSATPINPLLGSLANNGGPTQTHALLSGSPAIDAGDNCVTLAAHCSDPRISQLTTDQRGLARMVDGPDGDSTATVDIGAYEMQTALAGVPNQTTNEDTQLTVNFDPGDTSTITSVTATSDNSTLEPNDSAHLNASIVGASGSVVINPASNLSGTANITITINRSVGGPDVRTLLLTVNAVNDAPTFSKGPDQVVNEDAGAQTVNNWATGISAGPADESGQTLTMQVTGNNNPSLFSAAPAVSLAGTLTYTPAANANGSATITVTLSDNGGTANGGVDTASQSFTITVNSVNDPPSFTKGSDQTVNEDSPLQSVFWASNISAGPANESSQTLTFQIVNNTNPGLFSTAPSISSTGQLSYRPAANANGSATITVNLKDNGGTANGGVDTSPSQTFTITVTPVNDAPSFTKGANQTVLEDAGAQTVNNWATNISTGPADESSQTLTFQITNNTNSALFLTAPAVSSNGTLTYTLAANANGIATITINLKDNGGTANGGSDTSANQTFTISVTGVNDAPSFTKGADQSVDRNAGAQSVANWATNISSGPANEAGQTVAFQVTSNNKPGMFTVQPAISPTGTLTYTPNSNVADTATIRIVLTDNGGTATGGIDTSASQSFVITTTATGGSFRFVSSTGDTQEDSGFISVPVLRNGDTSKAVTVDYATSGDNGLPCANVSGVASSKCDFTLALGTLSFAAGETSKTITVLINQDSYLEIPEDFTITLSNPTNGAALSNLSQTTETIHDDDTQNGPNAIDDANTFVRMHYHDFLNREGDQSGIDFWTGQMTNCGSPDLLVCRVNVSGAFFLSIEFQQTGYLVERIYKTSYGDATATSTIGGSHQILVPMVRANEFLADTQRVGRGVVVGQTGWETVLENNKQAYALEFVQTSRFTTAFPTTMTPAQFVDKLNTNAGAVLSASERQAVINLFGNSGDTANVTARAQALRQVAEDQDLYNAEFNRAFVLTQYIGYLRRNPNDAPEPTLDYSGYDFWLTKLNQFNGNYIAAEMVKAFIASDEYRHRFGP